MTCRHIFYIHICRKNTHTPTPTHTQKNDNNKQKTRKKNENNKMTFFVCLGLCYKTQPLHNSVAHGGIESYNVSCHRGDELALRDLGTCGVVSHHTTSCLLLLPPGSCFCSITAINSAGVSPGASIRLLSRPEPGTSEDLK